MEKAEKQLYQHRPQTVQVNQLNQTTLKTTLLSHAQPSAPTRAKPPARPARPDPTPNPAPRAQHSQIRAQHSTARPVACPVSFFLR